VTPPFPAGIVEGFYGPPWSDEDRRSIVAFLGECGLGLYVYAPKDDPFHRERWREPYPPERRAALARLAAASAESGVSLSFAISPGLSIRYSSEADFARLAAKIDEARSIGIGSFALFLDDIPPDLVHPEDRERFADLGSAHAHLASRLKLLIPPGEPLLLCPTDYCGTGGTPYLASLGSALEPSVEVAWTGSEVVPGRIRRAEAEAFAASIRRRPFLWDNYPVNDFRRTRLFLGPYEGREPELLSAISGAVLNPMNEAECSKIAIATFAEFLADPAAYDPARAHARALERVAPDESDRRALAGIARLSLRSALRPLASPAEGAALAAFLEDPEGPSRALAVTEAAGLLRDLADASRRRFEGRRLGREIAPWVAALDAVASAIAAAPRALAADAGAGAEADEFRAAALAALRHRAEIGDPDLERFLRAALARVERARGLPHPVPRTNLSPERGRIAERALDDDPETSFWSRAPQRKGDQFGFDLGRPVACSAIILRQGEPPLRASEFVHDGVVEVSVEGVEWTPLARVDRPDLAVETRGRLVRHARLRVLSDGPNGVLIREFRAIPANEPGSP